jgi:hypothetical protein
LECRGCTSVSRESCSASGTTPLTSLNGSPRERRPLKKFKRRQRQFYSRCSSSPETDVMRSFIEVASPLPSHAAMSIRIARNGIGCVTLRTIWPNFLRTIEHIGAHLRRILTRMGEKRPLPRRRWLCQRLRHASATQIKRAEFSRIN